MKRFGDLKWVFFAGVGCDARWGGTPPYGLLDAIMIDWMPSIG